MSKEGLFLEYENDTTDELCWCNIPQCKSEENTAWQTKGYAKALTVRILLLRH